MCEPDALSRHVIARRNARQEGTQAVEAGRAAVVEPEDEIVFGALTAAIGM